MKLTNVCLMDNYAKTKTVRVKNVPSRNLHNIILAGGGGGGASDEVWDRETMFSQLAKRSIRGLVSGLPRRRYVFS